MSPAAHQPSALPGLILFAHGSRDPRWAQPFEAVAQRVRLLQPQRPVALAFLELMQPSLQGAVDALASQGVREITVLPLFLGTGGHVRQDLPRLINEIAQARPGLTMYLQPPVGEADSVLQAMAEVAAATALPSELAP
jgi:sirohydrochlorin cobaltochelatase